MELTKEYFDERLRNIATKQDLEGLATKAELAALREDATTLKAGVSGLTDDVASMNADIREIKETVARIDKRDIEDSNAFAKDIVQLQKDGKDLKLKHAS